MQLNSRSARPSVLLLVWAFAWSAVADMTVDATGIKPDVAHPFQTKTSHFPESADAATDHIGRSAWTRAKARLQKAGTTRPEDGWGTGLFASANEKVRGGGGGGAPTRDTRQQNEGKSWFGSWDENIKTAKRREAGHLRGWPSAKDLREKFPKANALLNKEV